MGKPCEDKKRMQEALQKRRIDNAIKKREKEIRDKKIIHKEDGQISNT